MTRYIITSGTSVVSELLETKQFVEVKVTGDAEKAISYDTVGEAMHEAAKVNNTMGNPIFKVLSVEV